MENPLVGKTITWTWEKPYTGAIFEVHFISSNQKRSMGRGQAAGYDAIHIYDFAVVAPDTYMLFWNEESDGNALTVILNLHEMKAYGSLTTQERGYVFMHGVIDEVVEPPENRND